MGEPIPIMGDAVRLLNADPLLRAARDITLAAVRGEFESNPKALAAATVIVASRTSDPATLLPKLRELAVLVQRHDAADRALGYAVSLQDVGEHTAALDTAWAEIVRVWTDGREWARGEGS